MTTDVTLRRQVGPEGVEVLPADADETDWLYARHAGIGASEVAAVLGESKYDSPYSLWARKTRRAQSAPRTKIQRRGIVFEQVIAETFADQHPEYDIRPVGQVRHTMNGHELATPDRELWTNNAGAGLLEAKTAGFGMAVEWGEEGTDDVPVAYSLQCQWQMAVTGYGYVWVAVMFSLDDYREYLVRRDDDVIAYLRERVHAFWTEHVLADVAPPVDGHDATTSVLRGRPSAGATELDGRIVELRAVHHAEAKLAAEHEANAAAAANEARQLLAGAEIGLYGGQPIVTNKMQAGRTGFDIDRFRQDYPDLAAQYVRRGADFPVLRWKRASV